ncbi:MAG: hypothetical protein HYY57_04395 [Candidatus Omnitrophica bacterium]|nr:hypothetical protein [Candidatus Omnitrophota bacterium]
MKKSKILQKDHEAILLLYRRMKPEERLVAYFNHSQLVNQIYLAGVNYRASFSSQSKKVSRES